MRKQKLLSEEKRNNILIELEDKPQKFVELKRALKLESNILSYNLKILINENMVEKDNLVYSLTHEAKAIMPYARKLNDASSLPLLCVAVIVKKENKILIRRKIKEPEKGKRIFIGGKIELGESIFDAAKRHVLEKVRINIKNLKVICINNYISKRKNISSHFMVFFITASPEGTPKDALWKNPEKIRGKMFPDNKFIINNMLNNRRIRYMESVYDEVSDRFFVVNIS